MFSHQVQCRQYTCLTIHILSVFSCITYLRLDINECTPDPCVNGGCADLVNGYVCACNPGYTGRNCDLGKDVVFSMTSKTTATNNIIENGRGTYNNNDYDENENSNIMTIMIIMNIIITIMIIVVSIIIIINMMDLPTLLSNSDICYSL